MPNWLMITLLFIVLSPGLLITIPAGKKGMWMSRQTSVTAIFVHAIIFIIIYQIYLNTCGVWEGFEDASAVDVSDIDASSVDVSKAKVISAVFVPKQIKGKPITSLIENAKAAEKAKKNSEKEE